ncbi:hypothetical protein phiOC_p294 [Ochrobactrum phage vB_OspM_OC]|nr:hypothetical protein phiOC_p294 [Ochrobactrum phage vB_OspM_OC]
MEETMSKLTEKRREDRHKMVEMIVDVTRRHGGYYDQSNIGSKNIFLDLTFHRGLKASIEFDGMAVRPDEYFVAWHMAMFSDACLDVNKFPADVNNIHQRKATYITTDFDDLLKHFDAVAKLAKEGTIFDIEAEKRYVEKNGSWQERKAKFDEWKKDIENDENKA